MKTTKTIKIGARTINLVEHASETAKAVKQRYEAGRDAGGNLYFKGKTGRWTMAFQTAELAGKMLKGA